MIIDLYSRYVTGWLLAKRETAELAERLLAETIRKQNVVADQLTIHADRGTSMASKPVALLLADLGVTKSHSGPIAPTTIRTQKLSSRRSSTDRSSLDGSAPSRMAARSASASSSGTTTSTATPVSVSTHQPMFTSAALAPPKSSGPACSRWPTPLTLSALSVRHLSHHRYRDLPGSTNPRRSRQHRNCPAD